MATKAERMWVAGLMFLLLTLCVPQASHAQAKPKRDVTKDQVERPAKKQDPPRTQPQSVPRTPIKKVARTKKPKTSSHQPYRTPQNAYHPTPKKQAEEIYLRVNQLSEVSRTFLHQGGKDTLTINTNSSDWSITGMPSWCRWSRKGSSLILTCIPNSSHDERKDFFLIRSGNKSVPVWVAQAAAPAVGGIESVMVWHNEKSAKMQGFPGIVPTKKALKIMVSGHVEEPLDKTWTAYVAFRHQDGTWAKANTRYLYGKFFQYPHDGELFGYAEFVPGPSRDGSFLATIEIPNEAFDVIRGKTRVFKCVLWLECEGCAVKNTRKPVTISITARNKKGIIKTK